MNWRVAAIAFALCLANPASGQDADKQIIDAILQELEMVPSLYARAEKPASVTAKFAADKLKPYEVAAKQTVDAERERWKQTKIKYAKTNPLRAALFEASQDAEELKSLKIQLAFISPPNPMFAAKQKAAVMQLQESLGTAIFKQEQTLKKLQEADEKRGGEKSLRWKADFDLAHARVQTNLLFLYEYSYALGRIRADALPELGKGQNAWQIVPRAKLTVTESKAKELARDRLKLLKKIQEDNADTPWAFVAERESRRDIGMEWAGKKK